MRVRHALILIPAVLLTGCSFPSDNAQQASLREAVRVLSDNDSDKEQA